VTLAEFAVIYSTLCVQLRHTDVDSVTVRAYYRVLGDLELEFVKLAAERLATTAEWFPKTAEWRKTARAVERERTEELQARLRKRREPLCLGCDDTGWRESAESGRFQACDCRRLRRLEVLGRRPMPELPPASDEDAPPDPRVTTAVQALAAAKGMP
jgi:hypothetical protein